MDKEKKSSVFSLFSDFQKGHILNFDSKPFISSNSSDIGLISGYLVYYHSNS